MPLLTKVKAKTILLFFGVWFLLFGVFVPQEAWGAVGIELRPVFDVPQDDSVRGAGESSIPVFIVKPGEVFVAKTVVAYTPDKVISPRVALQGLVESPVTCEPVAVGIKKSYGSSLSSGGKLCEVYLLEEGRKVLAETVEFHLNIPQQSATGDYSFSFVGFDAGQEVSREFILRVQGEGGANEDPGTCKVLNLNNALIIPQGKSNAFAVSVFIPYKTEPASKVKLSFKTEVLPLGVTGFVIETSAQKGSIFSLPLQVSNDAKPGFYRIKLISEFIGVEKFENECDAILVVDPVLSTLKIDPVHIRVAVRESTRPQVLAQFSDGKTVDVSNDQHLQSVVSQEGIVVIRGSEITGAREGKTILRVSFPDIGSESGIIKYAEVEIVVTEQTDFAFIVGSNYFVTRGGVVTVPIRLQCFNDFNGPVTNLKYHSPFNSSARFQLLDVSGKEVTEIKRCGEVVYLVGYFSEFVEPMSEPPPLETPQTFYMQGVGSGLARDAGYGPGVRIALLNITVFYTPKITIEAEGPVLKGQTSKVVWRTEHATKCLAVGGDIDSTWFGDIRANIESERVLGPFLDVRTYSFGITCEGALGSSVTTMAQVVVEAEDGVPDPKDNLASSKLDNSRCAQIGIAWPQVLGATGYDVLRGSQQNGVGAQVIARLAAGTATYTDANLPGGSFYHYWLVVHGSNGDKQYYIGGLGVQECRFDLSTSDVDILAVGDLAHNTGVQNPCSNNTEKLTPSEDVGTQSVITFAVNVCNSGQGSFNVTSITNKLRYLKQPIGGYGATFQYTDETGAVRTKVIPDKDITIGGDLANQVLTVSRLGVVPSSSNNRVVIRTLVFKAQVYLPEPPIENSYRFGVVSTINGYGSNPQSTSSYTLNMPSVLFYFAGREPRRGE